MLFEFKNKIENLAIELMDEHGLINKGWSFGWNFRKRGFGFCNYTKQLISLSYHNTPLQTEENIIDTIKHEIAHALAPKGSKHGPQWKKIAVEIGCNPKVCGSGPIVEPTYSATCWKCGSVYSRFHKSRRSHSCPKCSRAFNPAFLLHFKKN